MKRKSIISVLLLSIVFGMSTSSCSDMLSPDSERHAYTVAEDTLYSYWGILRSLQNIAERYVILNECRGDLVDETRFISDTISAIVNFGDVNDAELWKDGACAYLCISDYYHIINSCNAYIAMCDTARTTGTNKKYMIKEYAQVQSIRAWVYMQLLYAYGENRVPFYTEPMLTTGDIDNFVNDKSHPMLTASLLAQELGPVLEEMEPIEVNLGLPQYEGMPNYNNYGDANSGNMHFVCHSSRCMFPVSLVLGDIYLLSAQSTDDKETYRKAAQHYYNYINTQKCGPLPVSSNYSYGLLDDRQDYPIYNWVTSPYRETGAVSRTTEGITCIPSNKGKLEGKVMTDVNRLFGFDAEMRTSEYTSVTVEDDGSLSTESQTGASVLLSLNYERELMPSRGYEALCDSQKFEIYVFDDNGNFESLEELPGVGDARRAWIYSRNGRQWNLMVGDDILYGKYVSKQNPNMVFSTTYPIIYRKSTVWLRYAEALNRAGFPGYAFAILKSGLCNNPDWFPTNPKQTFANQSSRLYSLGQVPFDYPVTDTLYCYYDSKNGVYLPEDWEGANKMSSIWDLSDYLTKYFQDEFDNQDPAAEDPLTEPRTPSVDNVFWRPASENAFSNEPALSSDKACACYYLDRRELENASSAPFLDFKQTYLRGLSYVQYIRYKNQGKLLNNVAESTYYPSTSDDDHTYTIGVHQRGCGFIRYDDPEGGTTAPNLHRSSYNYVGMIQKKLEQDYGKTLSEADIYSGNYDADVQNAVEDLIIDECALELAFEGTRFSDLYRVAKRRNDPDYLAKRVAKRHTGEVDEKLRGRLMDTNNWFLPVPEE